MLETREKRQIASLVRGDLDVTSTTNFEHELMEIEIAQIGEKCTHWISTTPDA